MERLHLALTRLLKDDSGQDLVEYALVVALIALGSISAMKSLTNSISDGMSRVDSTLVSSVG